MLSKEADLPENGFLSVKEVGRNAGVPPNDESCPKHGLRCLRGLLAFAELLSNDKARSKYGLRCMKILLACNRNGGERDDTKGT